MMLFEVCGVLAGTKNKKSKVGGGTCFRALGIWCCLVWIE